MSDLKKYVNTRKERDPEFAENYEAGYRRFRDKDIIPRVISVQTVNDTELLIRFDNKVEKGYDVAPLFAKPPFHRLIDPAFFKAVSADAGGYGIYWDEEVDLSEYELWTNGYEPSQHSPHQGVEV